MKRPLLNEEDCDTSIKSYVKVGKSWNSHGWAISLGDFHDFIGPVEIDTNCHILIKGIISPCRMVVNPRLFYSDKNLSNHLKKLYEIDPNKRVPIELKFNKKDLESKVKVFNGNKPDYIDTKLTVGVSYRSCGWALAKKIRSQLLPLDPYKYLFPINVDGFKDHGRMNIQTRIFYKDSKLSKKLKELHDIDPNLKVSARIIFNETFLEETKNIKQKNKIEKEKLSNNINSQTTKNNLSNEEVAVINLNNLLTILKPGDLFYENDLIKVGFLRGEVDRILFRLKKYGLITRNFDGTIQLANKTKLDTFMEKWG